MLWLVGILVVLTQAHGRGEKSHTITKTEAVIAVMELSTLYFGTISHSFEVLDTFLTFVLVRAICVRVQLLILLPF